MRLTNIGARSNGCNYRVVLDSTQVSTNYIERTKGVRYDEESANHFCESCNRQVSWNQPWTNPNFASQDCACGRHATLLIIPFASVAVRR